MAEAEAVAAGQEVEAVTSCSTSFCFFSSVASEASWLATVNGSGGGVADCTASSVGGSSELSTSGTCLRSAKRPSRSERTVVPVGKSRSSTSGWPLPMPFSRISSTATRTSDDTFLPSLATFCSRRTRCSREMSTSSSALSSRFCQPVGASARFKRFAMPSGVDAAGARAIALA